MSPNGRDTDLATTGDSGNLHIKQSDEIQRGDAFTDTTEAFNEDGSTQYSYTATTQTNGSVTATITGQGDAAALSSASITLAANSQAMIDGTSNIITLSNAASLTLTGTGNTITLGAGAMLSGGTGDLATDTLTFHVGSGSQLTLDPNTFSAATDYSNSGVSYIPLITPTTGLALGTLAFDSTSGTDSFTLTDGLNIVLPGVTSNVIAVPAPEETPEQVLLSYLANLGDPLSATQLDQLNFNYLNPAGTPYTVTGSLEVNQTYATDEFFLTGNNPPGAVITGLDTVDNGQGQQVPVTNYLFFNINEPADLAQDTISKIQVLGTYGANVTLTQAEFSSFSTITTDDSGYVSTLIAATGGTFDLNKIAIIQSSGFNLTAKDWSGTTLIGNNQNGQTLTASLFGDNTLHAGDGAGDVLKAGEGVDTLIGGSGSDTFVASNGLTPGSLVEGNGTGNILQAEGDITGAMLTDVPTLSTNYVTLTAAQWNELTSIDYSYNNTNAVTVNLATAGSYDLGGKTLNAGIYYNFVEQGSGGSTLTGSAAYDEGLTASANGSDTLIAGAGNILFAGGGTDTLDAQSGENMVYGGSGADTIYAGPNDTVYAGTGTTTIYSTGGGTLDGGSGSDTFLLSGKSNTTYVTSAGGDITKLTGSSDVLNINGGGNLVTVSNTKNAVIDAGTGDVVSLGGTSNSATIANSGSSFDTINITGTNDVAEDTAGLDNSNANTMTLSGSTSSVTANGVGDQVMDYGTGDTTSLFGRSSFATIATTGSNDSIIASGTYDTVVDSGTGMNSITLESSGQMVLVNGSGNDTVLSTGGVDTLDARGSTGNVTLNAAAGTGDILYAGRGNDALYGGTEGTITAGSGSDTIYVGVGNTLYGGTGTDTFIINGSYISQTIPGGPGDITDLGGSSNAATITGTGNTISITGTGNTLSSSGAGDIITVGGSGHTISDAGASDTLTITGRLATVSDTGMSELIHLGGTKNSLTILGNGSTVLDAGVGNMTVLEGSNASGTMTSAGGTITATGTGDMITDAGTGANAVGLAGSGETGFVTNSTAGTLEMIGSTNAIHVENGIAGSGIALIGGANSLLEFAGATSDLVFFYSATNSTLQLDAPSSFTGTLTGLVSGSGQGIDLTTFLFSGQPTISKVTGTGKANTITAVTVSDGSQSVTLNLLNQTDNEYPVKASAYSLTADGMHTPGTLFEIASGAKAVTPQAEAAIFSLRNQVSGTARMAFVGPWANWGSAQDARGWLASQAIDAFKPLASQELATIEHLFGNVEDTDGKLWLDGTEPKRIGEGGHWRELFGQDSPVMFAWGEHHAGTQALF